MNKTFTIRGHAKQYFDIPNKEYLEELADDNHIIDMCLSLHEKKILSYEEMLALCVSEMKKELDRYKDSQATCK